MHSTEGGWHWSDELSLRMRLLSFSFMVSGRVRKKEAANIARMNLIRGTNMALQFAILPVAAFITFTVVRRLIGPLTYSGFPSIGLSLDPVCKPLEYR